MKLSHSRVNCYRQCPYQYKLRYIDKLKTIYNCDPQNALTLGTAIHTGIEHDVSAAIQQYYEAYPIIDDLHINETIKFEHLLPKVKEMLPDGKYEVKIEDDDFVGYIDLLAPVGTDEEDVIWYDMYDFKYSNGVDRYLESEQLHLYRFFYEKLNPSKRIKSLYYVFVPKTSIRQKQTENLYQFRKRLGETLAGLEIKIIEVEYDPQKVIDFLLAAKRVLESTEFDKTESKLCNFCEYSNFCQHNDDLDII